jgi:hypothetical protein
MSNIQRPISNLQMRMTNVEGEFGNWGLAVGHWKFIVGPRQGEEERPISNDQQPMSKCAVNLEIGNWKLAIGYSSWGRGRGGRKLTVGSCQVT